MHVQRCGDAVKARHLPRRGQQFGPNACRQAVPALPPFQDPLALCHAHRQRVRIGLRQGFVQHLPGSADDGAGAVELHVVDVDAVQ
jgi:hypothetical protein